DLIYTGGRVHVVDEADREAEALTVAGDRILLAGSDAEERAIAAPGACRVELRGRSLLPGFIDAHCHFTWLGSAQAAIDCKAPGMGSISRPVDSVRERAQVLPAGVWIRGAGYDQTRLAERRYPNRFDFDA